MLLGVPSNVTAQDTPTPSPTGFVITATPGVGTATPRGDGTTIIWNFRQSANFWTVDTGEWVAGQGIQDELGAFSAHGNGNEYAPVDRIVITYTSATTQTLDFNVSYDAALIVGGSIPLVNCYECSNIIIPMNGEAFDDIALDIDFPGAFWLHAITIILTVNYGDDPDYEIDDNGCPILSPVSINKLDPVYYSQCSRCFTTPTPQRGQQLPTSGALLPTMDVTVSPFQIPVIVSGTPQTPTPFGVGGGATSTPAPTNTPGGTWVHEFNFLVSDGDWYPVTSAGVTFGAWVSGSGWVYEDKTNVLTGITTAHRQVAIQGDFPSPIDLRSVTLTYDWQGGTYDNASLTAYGFTIGGGTVASNSRTGIGNGPVTAATVTWTGTADDASTIGFMLRSSRDITSPYSYSGNAVLRKVRIEAVGFNPYDLPTSTPAPTATNLPWFEEYEVEVADCSVPSFRNDTPAVVIPDTVTYIAYECYVIVPELAVSIPGQSDPFGIEGMQVCVNWFTFPHIEILGIVVPIDALVFIVVMAVVLWLLRF